MWKHIYKELPEYQKPVLVWITNGMFKFVSVCYLSEDPGGTLSWSVCGHNYPMTSTYDFDWITHWCDIPEIDNNILCGEE